MQSRPTSGASQTYVEMAPAILPAANISLHATIRQTDQCIAARAGPEKNLRDPVCADLSHKVSPRPPRHPASNDLFYDPITYDVMTDPVFCDDGYTYDRTTAGRMANSPMTQKPLRVLTANVALRSAIWDGFPELAERYHARKAADGYTGQRDARGVPCGRGRRVDDHQTSEEGIFRDGLLVEGSRRFANGGVMTGPFADGVLHGSGFCRWVNGDIYSGAFIRGKMQGRGVYIWSGGGRYEGDNLNDCMHGWGTRDYSDGTRYCGHFHADKRHGTGVLTWPNGSRFVGEFRDGKRHRCVHTETTLLGRLLSLPKQ